MKVICPNCKEVIDVKQDDKYGYCKHCSNQFVTSDALNLLVKQYKKINNYAKTQLFTNLNVDEAFSAYKSLLKLRPNDLNAITGMADCYFLGSTLDNFKGEEVINLFEEYDITLDRENSYLILNYMLEIMKYCRIYFREAERTKKDNKFIKKEYEEWFKKNNESVSKLLEYVDSIIPLVDKEELDTFRNDEQPQVNENFKALQTQCEENKTKVFECLNENEYECPYCHKTYTKHGICSHIICTHTEDGKARIKKHCKENSEKLKGRIAWNKGLTKETDERIEKAVENTKSNL